MRRGQVDLLVLETAQDALNLKAGLIGIEEAFLKIGELRETSPAGSFPAFARGLSLNRWARAKKSQSVSRG